MKWYKHDSDASSDAKIKKLLLRHGAVGYAIYFHCLELITSDVSDQNLTFELEHDSEIIADNLKIKGTSDKSGLEIVEETMNYIVDLDLFQSNGSRIFCMKMAQRLDQSMTNSKAMRGMIADLRDTRKGFIYVIKSEYGHKIGKTKNYESRLNLFNVKLPFDFEIVRLYASSNYHEDETFLHSFFGEQVLNGEWYNLSDNDIESIDEHMLNNKCEIVDRHDMSCKTRLDKTRLEEKEEKSKKESRVEKGNQQKKEKHPATGLPMSSTRYSSLCDKYGQATVDDYMERVLLYCESKGKTYRDAAATVAQWIKKDIDSGTFKSVQVDDLNAIMDENEAKRIFK